MNNINIYQLQPVKQASKDGLHTVKGIARTRLIHRIIREYGKYRHGNYAVNINDIDSTDLKLLLGYLLDSEELKQAYQSPTYLEAQVKEHSDHINELINYECYEVYQEDMEEMRSYK